MDNIGNIIREFKQVTGTSSSSSKHTKRSESLALMTGKSDVYECKVEIFGDIKNYDFLNIHHFEDGEVLCQVYNITRELNIMVGMVKIIGFRKEGKLQNIRKPFSTNATIQIATDEFIEKTLGLNRVDGAFIGTLEHHKDLKVKLDLRKILQKHISILAKSGAGKSYTVGVLLEEIIQRGIPIVILDPHSEYSTLDTPNDDLKDIKKLSYYGLKPQEFKENVRKFSPNVELNPGSQKITLNIKSLNPMNFVELLPNKLSPSQKNLIMTLLSSSSGRVDFEELIFNLSNEESNSKWDLIAQIEQLKQYKIFTDGGTPLSNIVEYGKASIISLKGVESYVRETLVTNLLQQLFEARKKNEIPPFFLVLEEAHNFAPEKGSGASQKPLNIIRTLAGEGRKFGLGLCVISQRPAKVDKNVLSQCSTQLIMNVTNVNDLKSIVASTEGLNSSAVNEISQLNVGTCMLTGIVQTPLKVNVRPRMSKHGGEGASINLEKIQH